MPNQKRESKKSLPLFTSRPIQSFYAIKGKIEWAQLGKYLDSRWESRMFKKSFDSQILLANSPI
jgi:hypothetical protein